MDNWLHSHSSLCLKAQRSEMLTSGRDALIQAFVFIPNGSRYDSPTSVQHCSGKGFLCKDQRLSRHGERLLCGHSKLSLLLYQDITSQIGFYK